MFVIREVIRWFAAMGLRTLILRALQPVQRRLLGTPTISRCGIRSFLFGLGREGASCLFGKSKSEAKVRGAIRGVSGSADGLGDVWVGERRRGMMLRVARGSRQLHCRSL